MSLCDHEEADTRLIVHIGDALTKGWSTCLVRTVDTDVVVILIGKFFHFKTLNSAANIWVAFGSGKNFSFWHVNTICHNLGRQKSQALPFFHSFTGCDTTSSFFRKGRKLAWEAWNSFPEVTGAFVFDPFTPIEAESPNFILLQRFTILLYNKHSSAELVNEARQELFCRENKSMENIPPTSNALLQHIKRAAYQASIWVSSDQSEQRRPSPKSWGWTWEEQSKKWIPVWITQAIASTACLELVKCACKSVKGCGSRCTCKKANWSCTELCKCNCLK